MQIKPQNKVAPFKPSASINECGLQSNHSNSVPANNDRVVVLLNKNTNLQEKLKTNILGSNSQLKRLEWPHASIPRTVQKLSWDDELEKSKDREIITFMDPDVSVTPLQPVCRSSGDIVRLK